MTAPGSPLAEGWPPQPALDAARAPILERGTYARPAVDVARAVLGKLLVRRIGGEMLIGRIAETEAYTADIDESCHAYRRQTPRNRSMFGPPGHAYVYRSYGIHYCLNIVTTMPGGPASAVLIRGLEPVAGVEAMRVRRPGSAEASLLRGPGNLCRALGIDLALDGADLLGADLHVLDAATPIEPVITTVRIGITRSVDLPWRFYLLGSPGVSRPDRSAERLLRIEAGRA